MTSQETGPEIRQEIRRTVREWFLTELLDDSPPQEFDDDLDLRENGVLDSLSTLQFVAFLEERYGIEVEVDEAGPDNLGTVRRIVAYLARKVTKA